jgi:hypothetical protein
VRQPSNSLPDRRPIFSPARFDGGRKGLSWQEWKADFSRSGKACKRGLHGASPSPIGDRLGAVAQLGERVVRNDEVSGSIPLGSTIFPENSAFYCGHVARIEVR